MPAPQAARGGSNRTTTADQAERNANAAAGRPNSGGSSTPSSSAVTTTRRPGQSASRPTSGGASTTAQAASRPVNTPQPSGQVARPRPTSTYVAPPPTTVTGSVTGPAPTVVAPTATNTAVNSSPNHGTVYTGGTPTLAYGKKGVTSQAGLKYRKAPRPVYTGGTPTSAIGYRGVHKRPDYTMGTPTNAAGYSKRTPGPNRNSLPGDFGRPMNGPDVSPAVHGAMPVDQLAGGGGPVSGPASGTGGPMPRRRGPVDYSPPSSFAGGQYQQPSRPPIAPGAAVPGPNTEGSRPPQTRTDRAVRRSGSTRTTSPKSWTGK